MPRSSVTIFRVASSGRFASPATEKPLSSSFSPNLLSFSHYLRLDRFVVLDKFDKNSCSNVCGTFYSCDLWRQGIENPILSPPREASHALHGEVLRNAVS